MSRTVSFHEVPASIRPHCLAELVIIRVAGMTIGSLSQLRLTPGERIHDGWTWFVVMNGDFRAGRTGRRQEATEAIKAAVALLGGVGRDEI